MRLLALGLSDEAAKERNHLHPEGLNAPFGARRFLTRLTRSRLWTRFAVLMRLLALGAF